MSTVVVAVVLACIPTRLFCPEPACSFAFPFSFFALETLFDVGGDFGNGTPLGPRGLEAAMAAH